jgi:hypothetical protein
MKPGHGHGGKNAFLHDRQLLGAEQQEAQGVPVRTLYEVSMAI